jgi:hypothetical protein
VSNTAQELNFVLLKLHPSPSPDTETTTSKVAGEIDAGDVNIGGQALKDRH